MCEDAVMRWPAKLDAWWIARGAGAVALVIYFIAVMQYRMKGASGPYAIHGDQMQAVWQFWRYHVDGALPAGQLLTDYAYAYHAPPWYWAIMATLSTVFEPLMAGKILHVVSWAALALAVAYYVGKHTEWLLGMAAAVIVLRSPDLAALASGGLARGFGPLLIVVFLIAFTARKHVLCLAILVVQAALYPPTALACALTYGAWCVLAPADSMRARMRRCAGMFIAGLMILALSRFQNVMSPDWWGPIVTYEEAEPMPAWRRPGGRIPEVPIRPVVSSIVNNFNRGHKEVGHVLAPTAVRKLFENHLLLLGLPALLAFIPIAVDRWRRLWWGTLRPIEPAPGHNERFPWEIVALAVGAHVGYFLARAVIFKLYLPQRQLTHTTPYLLFVGLPILSWYGARVVVGARRWATLLVALSMSVLPTLIIRGDGLGGTSWYADWGRNKAVWEKIKQLPLTANIACDNEVCDLMGSFSYHAPYANRTMTHPFRKGYYDEAERRLEAMNEALLAISFDEFAQFVERERIDYFIYNTSKLRTNEKLMHLPARGVLDRAFARAQKHGPVLEHPPAEAVLWRVKLRAGDTICIDVKKLLAWRQAQGPATE